VGTQSTLTQVAFRRLTGLLVHAEDWLAHCLLFSLAETDDEGVVAVLLFGSLSDDGEIALDDGAPHDGAVLREVLGHTELLADDAGMGVHVTLPWLAWRG